MQEEWQWARVAPADGSPSPPKRDMAAMVALSGSQLLLFGGRAENSKGLADTWAFDLTT